MNFKLLAIFVGVVLLCAATGSSASAQGKGKGGGQGKGSGKTVGSPPILATDTSTSNSHGKSNGKGNSKSNGNSDTASDVNTNSHGNGKGNSQNAKQKAAQLTDKDLNRYKGLSKKLGTTPEEMRNKYEKALATNPDLTYGNFVSAHMAADNLGGRYPNVTSDAILIGMSRGRSLGQTLQDLKVSPQHSQSAQDTISEKLRNAKID